MGTGIFSPASAAADEKPQFYRAINLNGPAVVIDGHQWEAGNAAGLSCDDAAFENQSPRLIPATDSAPAGSVIERVSS